MIRVYGRQSGSRPALSDAEATGLVRDEEYGPHRLRDHAIRAEASAENILEDVRKFANGEGLHDDATVIFVKA